MMSKAVSDLSVLLQSMEPELQEGEYVYVVAPADTDLSTVNALATFRETEGMTLIITAAEAVKRKFPIHFRAAWITLRVHSALQAVGLTAAFSRALGEAGISCNVVAATYHDHIFVPVELAEKAMNALKALQEQVGF